MTKKTNYFADTTDIAQLSSVIDDALRSLRITGSLLLRETYAPPWSISIPDSRTLAEMLKLDADIRVLAFHLVEFGHCELRAESGDRLILRAGDIAILFSGGAHRLGQGESTQAQTIESLLRGGPNIRRSSTPGEAAGAALLCGVFLLHDTWLNPLLTALPQLLHTSLSQQGEMHNLSGVARLLAEETDRLSLGKGYVTERLLEVLCAEAIRAHLENLPENTGNWLKGLRDPVVGRAIAAVHANPGENWSVSRLAAIVSMSPSRFAARFSTTVGAAPMNYVTQWRMSIACRRLSATKLGIERIAAEAGYESQAAFSRAFKKQTGMAPFDWRRKRGSVD